MPIPSLIKKPTAWQATNRSNTPMRHQQTGRSQGGRKILKTIGVTSLIVLIAGGIGGLLMLLWVAKDLPNPNRIIDRTIALSTKIYDRTGTVLLYDIHGNEQRTLIELSSIPMYIQHATLVAEDRDFYQHGGIKLTSIIRSIIVNLLHGEKAQGGSTLTQQLVKNAILSPEKTYIRKIREILLSYQIEQNFTKDQILKMYFNEIPYGSTAYGIEAAAQTYFGKSVKDLDIAEGAIIAGIPKAPTYYSPYGSHKDQLIQRQQTIIDGMAAAGYITEADAKAAKEEQLNFKQRVDNIIAPHFVLYVKEYLTDKYSDLTVEQGGLKVITSLDVDKQKMAEKAIADAADKNASQWQANNAALVAMDPKNGQILAMVGSKDYFGKPTPEGCQPGKNCTFDPQVNATIRSRQPGSSFKPIVYAAAFRKGYTPSTVLYDVETTFRNFDGNDYQPHNYDLKQHGPVTMRTALAGSLNIPAVKTIYLTGVDNVIDLAESLGYSTLKDRSRFGLALVLGGAEVKLVEHVSAYATFAAEGSWHQPIAVLKVTDKDGAILEDNQPIEKKVLETQVAQQINDVLSDNDARSYIFGAKNNLTLADRPVAAKSGTTNDNRDAWTIGYTPSLVAGVWVGNNNNDSMKRGADGSIVAAPIWRSFMTQALAKTSVETFNKPEPVITGKPVLDGTLLNGLTVKVDKLSGKLATSLTPDYLIEEKTFRQSHDILYYVNKEDPRGNTPPDPSDQEYQRWEDAARTWAVAHNYTDETPPTEYDDIHVVANQPRTSIVTPSNDAILSNRTISASVSIIAPETIREVRYYLNGRLIQIVSQAPFNLSVTIADPAITSGSAVLTATAFDDQGNNGSDSVNITLAFPDATQPITWITPKNNGVLKNKTFPTALTFSVTQPSLTQQVDIWYQTSTSSPRAIGSTRALAEGTASVTWHDSPGVGTYTVYGTITNNDGYSFNSLPITIEIK